MLHKSDPKKSRDIYKICRGQGELSLLKEENFMSTHHIVFIFIKRLSTNIGMHTTLVHTQCKIHIKLHSGVNLNFT